MSGLSNTQRIIVLYSGMALLLIAVGAFQSWTLSLTILNLCLIPRWGAEGAVFASLLAELLISTLYLLYCEGMMTLKQIGAFSYKRVIAGAVMATGVYLLGRIVPNAVLGLCLQVLCGVILYLLLLLAQKDSFVTGAVGRYVKIPKKEGNKKKT